MTKDTFYFSHDSNARNDVKVIKLRRVLGMEGYGIYFCLIEILREQKDHTLPLSSINDIAFDLRVSEEKIQSVIVGFDLFDIVDEEFFSIRLLRSMKKYNDKKRRLSEAGRRGNEKRWNNRIEISSGGDKKLSGGDPDPIALKESKEKESKEESINNADLGSRVEETQQSKVYTHEEKCQYFIDKFNETKIVKGKKSRYRINDKVRRALKLRLNEGYTSKDFVKAIKNCMNNRYHIENGFTNLTPEFILRPDKLEVYLNAGDPDEIKKESTQMVY